MKTKSMYEVLNLLVGKSEGQFGVEIEVEGTKLPNQEFSKEFDKYWKVELDGSLKAMESLEYVFRSPLNIEQSEEALTILYDAFEKNKSVIDNSGRAGVHVHLNVQSLTPIQLMTFATLYYVMEDYFVHWCGEARVGNHFCLRASDAEAVIYKLLECCKNREWRHLNTDDIRYASLNWNSLFKYGSVEFRSMRSTDNKNDILTYINLINQLLKASYRYNNPQEVIEFFSMHGNPFEFVQIIMEEYANEFVNIKNVDIIDSMRVVQPLAFLVDWEKFKKEKVNPFK